MKTIEHYVQGQNEKRDLWVDHDSEQELYNMAIAELHELWEETQIAMVTDEVFRVASEVGDYLYLCIRYELKYKKLPDYLSRMREEVLIMCEELGIDPEKAIEMKVFRNSYKYQDHLMSNGRDHSSATQIAKESWKAMGGDVVFSHVYLDYLAHVD